MNLEQANNDAPGLVSIVIPCYNHASLLPRAIRSALAQTYRPIEVIVVDDGSTDATEQVARGFGGDVRYVRQDNAGLSAARNTGVGQARGEYLLFLDADDEVTPGFLASVLAAAPTDPSASVYCGGWRAVGPGAAACETRGAPDFGGDPYLTLLAHKTIPVHANVVRRGAISAVGGFDPSLRACEDWDVWLKLAASGHRLVATAGGEAIYYRADHSMSTDLLGMARAGATVLGRHRRAASRGPAYASALSQGYGLLCDYYVGRYCHRELDARPPIVSHARLLRLACSLWRTCRPMTYRVFAVLLWDLRRRVRNLLLRLPVRWRLAGNRPDRPR